MLRPKLPSGVQGSTSAVPFAAVLPRRCHKSSSAPLQVHQARSPARAGLNTQAHRARTALHPRLCLPSLPAFGKWLPVRVRLFSCSCWAARELVCPDTVREQECPHKTEETSFPPSEATFVGR